MATKQITGFPVTTTIAATDVLHVNQSAIDRQVVASDLKDYTDQTGAEIKLAYEAEADTNEFSDAEQTKLAGIETAATADQTGAEIKVAYELEANTNEFNDAEKTKLGTIASGANNYSHPHHSGDVTSVNDGATTIAAGAVTLTKMANMATDSLMGRDTVGTGSPEILTPAQVRTILNVEDGSTADQSAAEVVFTVTGDISSTDVQAAIAEVDSEKLSKASNLSDLANASTARTNLSISATNTPSSATGDIVATNVQAAIAELDSEKMKLDSKLTKAVGGGTDVTLTAGEADNSVIELTGVLTANINLIVPTIVHRVNYYNNTTGAFSLTIKTAAGTGISVGQGLRQDLSGDGTNIVTLSAGTVANLAIGNRTTTTLDVTNDVGNNATVPESTTSLAGLINSSDKTKLDAITGTNTGDEDKASIDALGVDAATLDGNLPTAFETADAAIAKTDTQQDWTVQQVTPPVALSPTATIAWNLDTAPNATIALDGTTTAMGTPTNIRAGNIVNISMEQDVTGSRVVTWPSAFEFGDGDATLTVTASKFDVLSFLTVSTSKLRFLGIVKGFAN